MKNTDINDIEDRINSRNESQEKRWVIELISKVRSLEHDLRNPNYLYADSRIHRQAILCRNSDIALLQQELHKVKEELKVADALKEEYKNKIFEQDAEIKRLKGE